MSYGTHVLNKLLHMGLVSVHGQNGAATANQMLVLPISREPFSHVTRYNNILNDSFLPDQLIWYESAHVELEEIVLG